MDHPVPYFRDISDIRYNNHLGFGVESLKVVWSWVGLCRVLPHERGACLHSAVAPCRNGNRRCFGYLVCNEMAHLWGNDHAPFSFVFDGFASPTLPLAASSAARAVGFAITSSLAQHSI